MNIYKKDKRVLPGNLQSTDIYVPLPKYSVSHYSPSHILFFFSFYLEAFSFTLLLAEGLQGEAWEPSNKMMGFLPPRWNTSHFLHDYHFHYPFLRLSGAPLHTEL
jgi:hypothetical protein